MFSNDVKLISVVTKQNWFNFHGQALPVHLPGSSPPGEWLEGGFRLPDLTTVTRGDLPARLDWSIMGCTILLRALINL